MVLSAARLLVPWSPAAAVPRSPGAWTTSVTTLSNDVAATVTQRSTFVTADLSAISSSVERALIDVQVGYAVERAQLSFWVNRRFTAGET